MLFAILLTTAREIYKDLEDETGDLKAGIMTFPLIAGAPTARRLAGLICLFTWAILPLPVAQGYYPMLFLIITGIAFTPAVIAILVFANKRNYRNAQKLVKIAVFEPNSPKWHIFCFTGAAVPLLAPVRVGYDLRGRGNIHFKEALCSTNCTKNAA